MKSKIIIIAVLLAIVATVTYAVKNKEKVRVPTSADNAPPGSIHNLPVPEAVQQARVRAAADLGVDLGRAIVESALEKEWSDSCLGLGGPAESCLQVITPGYEVVVSVDGRSATYRTNMDGSVIRKQD